MATTYNIDAQGHGDRAGLTSLADAKRTAREIVGRIAVYGPWEHLYHEDGKTCERMLAWTSRAEAKNDPGVRSACSIERITRS